MLNSFWKRRTIRNNRQATGDKNIITYLPFYTDLASLRPVDYRIPEDLIDLEENLDAKVREIIDLTGIDDLNSGALYDKHIDSIVETAREDVNKQRADHMHIIAEIRSIEMTRLEETALIKKVLEARIGIGKEVSDHE